MKKLSILLFFVLMLSFLFACDTANTGKDYANIKPSTTVLSSFETYDEIMRVELSQRFGKLDRNADEQFVANGSYSMAVYPYGDFEANIEPKMSLMLQSKYTNKPDFSNAQYVTLDVYNASESEKTIEVYFKSKNNIDEDVYLPIHTYVLKPQTWNTVNYDFNDGAMVKSYSLNNMQSMEITFKEHRQTSAPYTPDVYYFDKLVCFEAKGISYQPSRGQNELMSFENTNDVYLLTRSQNCNVSINTNRLYTTEGNISARVNKMDANNGVITIVKGVFGSDKFNNASKLSVDIFNGDEAVGYYQLKFIYEDEDLIERTFGKSKVINACDQGTIEVSVNDLPEGITFGNVVRIELQLSSTTCYIDNITVQ